MSVDDLPDVPLAYCQLSVVESAFSSCGEGASTTCCSAIGTAFGPQTNKTSRNCLCLSPVLAAAKESYSTSLDGVLSECKSRFRLAASWADEPSSRCPELPPFNDPRLWKSLAPNVLLLMLIYWACARALAALLTWRSAAFAKLGHVVQRNVVTYLLEIVVTSAALGLALLYGGDLLFHNRIGRVENFVNLRTVLLLVGTLYVFELCYRVRTGVPLTVHHLVTVALQVMLTFSLYDSAPSVEARTALRIGLLISLHACTEQVTFFGLILYRWRSRYASLVLKVSTWQTLVFRLVLHVVTWLLFARAVEYTNRLPSASRSSVTWKGVWTYTLPILNAVLFVAQMWAIYIIHCLALKVDRAGRTGQFANRKDPADVDLGSAWEKEPGAFKDGRGPQDLEEGLPSSESLTSSSSSERE